jgi:hypothetical protein
VFCASQFRGRRFFLRDPSAEAVARRVQLRRLGYGDCKRPIRSLLGCLEVDLFVIVCVRN